MSFNRFLAFCAMLALLAAPPAVQAQTQGQGKAKTTGVKKVGKKGKGGKKGAAPQAAPTPVPKLDGIQPYLTFKDDPARSMIVNWWNPKAAGDSTVLYGTTAAYGQTASDPAVSNFHHVELKGLTPGATYHYQIKSSDGTVGEDNTFTLPEEGDTDFMFAVSGDSRNGGNDQDTTRSQLRKEGYDHIASKQPAMVINVGDVALRGNNPYDWYYFFNSEANCFKRAPYMIAMGNHEVSGKDGVWPGDFLFYQLFAPAYPANGTPGDSGQPTALGMNFSYNYGNAHFVFLASQKMTPESQAEWLDRDLAAARANPTVKWVFAVMHGPMYTWGKGHKAEEKELEAWGPIFDKYHVDIAFAGHNHIYERSHVIKGNKIVESGDPAQGTIYMTCGLGGAPPHNANDPDPKYPFIAKSYNAYNAAAFIRIQGDKLEMKYINAKDELIDSFTIDKSAKR